MDLSLEAYRLIIKNVPNRSDLCSLCRVTRGFRYVAERALYNTIFMHDPAVTMSICTTLATQPRVSVLVDALTIFAPDDDWDSTPESTELAEYWSLLARALRRTIFLRHLNIHLNNAADSRKAWILSQTTFQLRSFHCDLAWDRDLISFFNTQHDIRDLYLADYSDDTSPSPSSSSASVSKTSSQHATPITIDPHCLARLAILECTFTEAAALFARGRPLTHVKTCFSQTLLDRKQFEMATLFQGLQSSGRSIRSLDIADSVYDESFALELLETVITTPRTTNNLRYLGTIVLPVDGRERLQFYGLLRRLPRLQCVEVEVTEWEPAPTSRAALRALATELRLYCATVTRVVFVHNFDRFAVAVVNGHCDLDHDVNTDSLWREYASST